MARPVTTLAVFFIAFNLFAGTLGATGVADAIGLNSHTGHDQAVNETTSTSEIETGAPTGSTLFGMYNVLASQVTGLFDVIFPGLAMLDNAGVPSYITDGILSPLFSFILVIGGLSFLRGWDL